MDPIIRRYSGVQVDDLFHCDCGIAYQTDRSNQYDYGQEYFDNYINREDTPIAIKLNEFRNSITEKYCKCVLDVGVGSGEFIKKSSIKTFGYDVNPHGINWLKDRGIYLDIYEERWPDEIDGVSLWDTMEHIPNPTELIKRIRGGFLFISLPIFKDCSEIRQSKHYKPNEHLYYFTEYGLEKFLSDSGFYLVEKTDAESKAGREGVLSFVFRKF